MPIFFLRILPIFFILSFTYNSLGQSEQDSTKQQADLEFTILGGSVSVYKKTINRHTFGASIGAFTYGYIIFDNPTREESQDALDDTRGLFEYGKIKLFYRYRIGNKILLQTGIKYNFTAFGEGNCDPCSDALLGLESSFIYKFGKILGYKADISTVVSPKDGKFYVYINPLIVCFNF